MYDKDFKTLPVTSEQSNQALSLGQNKLKCSQGAGSVY